MDSALIQVLTDASLLHSIIDFIPTVASLKNFVNGFQERENGKHVDQHLSSHRTWPWRCDLFWRLGAKPFQLWHVVTICKDKQVLSALSELSKITDPNFIEVMGYAVTHTGDIAFLDWVYNKFTADKQPCIFYDQFEHLAECGNLNVICWVHGRGYEPPASMLGITAGMGNMPLVQYLLEHGAHGCLNLAVGYAAEFGHLDIIKFLHDNRALGDAKVACNDGFSRWQFYQKVDETCFTPSVMTDAAVYDYLGTVKFLHKNRSEGCTLRGLREGQPHVIEFIKLYRPMKQSGHLTPLRSLVGRIFKGEKRPLTLETYEYFDDPQSVVIKISGDRQ